MLTAIEVRNSVGALVETLRTFPAPLDRYKIRSIDGLGPVAAQINTTSYATQDGGFFQSAKVGERNIVLELGYRPVYSEDEDSTFETWRRALYQVFPPKQRVNLRFYNNDTDYQIVQIDGIVESHVPTMYTKEPTVQVSIRCPKPYFRETDAIVQAGTVNLAPVEFPYRGDAETGFSLEIDCKSRYTKFIIYNASVSNPIVVDFPMPNNTLVSDKFQLSTIQGNKYIRIKRGGSTINVLENLTSGSMSMLLSADVTNLTVEAIPVPGDSSASPFYLTSTAAYVGL